VHRLRQLHGNGVVVVGVADGRATTTVTPPLSIPEGVSIPEGDAVVSADRASVLAVLTADCAPVALGSPGGTRAAVHAGWRGLCAGVIRRAAEVMRDLGAERVVAGIGPTIGPCCYEFSPADLDRLCAAFGDVVRAQSRRGRPALDLPAAVRVALGEAGVELVVDAPACTACSDGYFSHRARGERQRQALFVWRDGSGG